MTAPIRARRALAAVGLLAVAGCAAAGRARGPLVTDRPDFTESPNVVPTVQAEAGVTATSAPGENGVALGELLVRVPVGSRLEARFGVGSIATSAAAGERTTGYEDPELQLKLALGAPGEHASRLVPTTALIVGTTLPVGSRALSVRVAQPGAKLIAGWELGDRLDLTSNLDWAWVGERGDRFGQASATVSLGISASDRVGSFLEYYDLLPGEARGGAAHYGDAGLTWLVRPDLQLDVRAGARVGGPRERFVGVGVARRW